MSADAAAAVSIEDSAIAVIVATCQRAGGRETGGVLVGRYSDLLDHAVISEATPPPADSSRFPAAFVRGIRGLSALLKVRWRRHQHYLGEWHFHPGGSPQPSPQDLKQMRAFAAAPEHQCPRPILVVLGGDPSGVWNVSVTLVDAQRAVPLAEALPPADAPGTAQPG